MKKNIAILFGGISAEHEVSVISGIQVVEKIDRDLYEVFPIYFDKSGVPYYINFQDKKDFLRNKRFPILFGKNKKGGFIQYSSPFLKKVYIDCSYLAFHGSYGEKGSIQGLLDMIDIAYTSCSVEGCSIAMNKVLTKEVLEKNNIQTIPWMRIFQEIENKFLDKEFVSSPTEVELHKNPRQVGTSQDPSHNENNLTIIVQNIIKKLGLPVIIKPVHLGSSIGIFIARSEVELEKHLLEARFLDSEILIEKYLINFKEYNCSVRYINGKLEYAEIEKPISKEAILSFTDKYANGAKKTSGMASLDREIPAKITQDLKTQMQELAKQIFTICRLKGMVRIDFMVTKDAVLYPIEINPIPGSMAFYLWESSGISFKQQITDLIEQSIKDFEEEKGKRFEYKTDIIQKFIQG